MKKINSLAGILDFFIPAEVLSAVLLVFTMENILNYAFLNYIPAEFEAVGWMAVYLIGIASVSILNYVTADEEELEDLDEDFDQL